MERPRPQAHLAALLAALLLGSAAAYYVPGTYPQEYSVGDSVSGARGGALAFSKIFGARMHGDSPCSPPSLAPAAVTWLQRT
jgi:hypothetical protein